MLVWAGTCLFDRSFVAPWHVGFFASKSRGCEEEWFMRSFIKGKLPTVPTSHRFVSSVPFSPWLKEKPKEDHIV